MVFSEETNSSDDQKQLTVVGCKQFPCWDHSFVKKGQTVVGALGAFGAFGASGPYSARIPLGGLLSGVPLRSEHSGLSLDEALLGLYLEKEKDLVF